MGSEIILGCIIFSLILYGVTGYVVVRGIAKVRKRVKVSKKEVRKDAI